MNYTSAINYNFITHIYEIHIHSFEQIHISIETMVTEDFF